MLALFWHGAEVGGRQYTKQTEPCTLLKLDVYVHRISRKLSSTRIKFTFISFIHIRLLVLQKRNSGICPLGYTQKTME